MRSFAMSLAAAAVVTMGLLTTPGSGQAWQSSRTGHDPSTYPASTSPAVQLVSCNVTYRDGCLPHQMLRPGPRGWACYPC